MSTAPFLQETAEGVYLSVKVQPRSSRNAISGMVGSELKVSVTAPPVDAAANTALLEFIAKSFDYPRSSVQLARGNTSRHKRLFIRGARAADILKRLEKK
jgi:hypothetical protein